MEDIVGKIMAFENGEIENRSVCVLSVSIRRA